MTRADVRILVAMPNTGMIQPDTLESVQRAIAASQCSEDIQTRFLSCAPVELARHRLVREFLEQSQASHLLFVDSDMGLPDDAIDRLIALDKPIAALPCAMFDPSTTRRCPGVTTNIWRLESPPETPLAQQIVRFLNPDELPDEPFPCHATGLACCMIRREALEAMPWPMFAFTFADDYQSTRVSEDAHFFALARQRGYQVWVDPGVICDHYKSVDLTRLEDFFADDPLCWPWHKGRCPETVEPVFIACVSDGSGCRGEVAQFLAEQARHPDRTVAQFVAARWATALKEAVRRFLGRQSERWLFITDGQTCPPNDLLDRCLATGIPVVSGLFRELADGTIVYGAARRDDRQRWRRLEHADAGEPQPVDAVSLRALLLSRELLTPLGSSWLRGDATPFDAGVSLAETLWRRHSVRPTLAPVGCAHYAVIGLLPVLENKMRLRAQLRQHVAENARRMSGDSKGIAE